jgi:hypothetical protein
MSESVEQVPEALLYFGTFEIMSLIVVIAYSIRKGGAIDVIKEVIENLFLWFLLTLGVANFTLPPVDADDEIAGAILLTAFGICRIAKHTARKTEAAGS